MMKVRELKQLLANIPDNAHVWAYEGENVGLSIIYVDHVRDSIIEGFINTGDSEALFNPDKHELNEFQGCNIK